MGFDRYGIICTYTRTYIRSFVKGKMNRADIIIIASLDSKDKKIQKNTTKNNLLVVRYGTRYSLADLRTYVRTYVSFHKHKLIIKY